MSAEARYPYVHVDVDPEMVDELSALLFELGAEGVEERDEGTLARGAATGKTMASRRSKTSVTLACMPGFKSSSELGISICTAAVRVLGFSIGALRMTFPLNSMPGKASTSIVALWPTCTRG